MKASIVIPSHNHAHYIATAICCALAQTEPAEIIVVDDGSTDDTQHVVHRFDCVRYVRTQHRGVAAARNLGMRIASAPYLMFLDADDEIAPGKVALQAAMLDADPACGWVICDTLIEDDISHQIVHASERYGYDDIGLVGDVSRELERRNFIPVHAPLIRRSMIGDAQFPEGKLEDWAFWRQLAATAPVRYIPETLAVYHKRRSGRNSQK